MAKKAKIKKSAKKTSKKNNSKNALLKDKSIVWAVILGLVLAVGLIFYVNYY